MKRIIVIFLLFFSIKSFGQGSPTGSKTQFKNGIALGSKDSSVFLANDSLFLTIDRNNRLLWRNNGASGAWNVVARNNDTSYLANFVRLQTGNLYAQPGKMAINDSAILGGKTLIGNTTPYANNQTGSQLPLEVAVTASGGGGIAVSSIDPSYNNEVYLLGTLPSAIDASRKAAVFSIRPGFITPNQEKYVAEVHATSVVNGIGSDKYAWVYWADKGMAIFPPTTGVPGVDTTNAPGKDTLRVHGYGLFDSTLTAKSLAQYSVNRGSLYTSRSFTDKNYVDSSINLRLLISDTAAMKATITLDRVLANGNISGRNATVGDFNAAVGYFSSNLTSAAKIRSDKAFFSTASTGATDTVVSVVSGAVGPAMVVNNTNGQALRVETVNAIGLSATSTGSLGQAITAHATGGGEIFVATNGSTRVFEIKNSGKTILNDSLVIDVNNKSLFGKNAANNAVIQLIGTNTLDQINIASGGNQVNVGGILNGTSVVLSGNLTGTTASLTGNSTTVALNTSTRAIDVTGKNGFFAVGITGGATTGQSFGQTISAGTNSSDVAFQVFDKAETTQYFGIRGDGQISALPTYSVTVGGTNRDLFIDNTGLIGYVPSVRKSKKNIEDIGNTHWLHQLRPVKFNYRVKDSTGKYTDSVYKEKDYGLIAEEVEPVNKELVFYDVNKKGKIDLAGVKYSQLIVPILKEIQEQKKTITALEARIAKLEALVSGTVRKTRTQNK